MKSRTKILWLIAVLSIIVSYKFLNDDQELDISNLEQEDPDLVEFVRHNFLIRSGMSGSKVRVWFFKIEITKFGVSYHVCAIYKKCVKSYESTAYSLWTFTWFVHFELPFSLKGTDKIHTKGLSKFHSNIYSILFGFSSGIWSPRQKKT